MLTLYFLGILMIGKVLGGTYIKRSCSWTGVCTYSTVTIKKYRSTQDHSYDGHIGPGVKITGDLSGANLYYGDLRGVDFDCLSSSGNKLTGAYLQRADLSGATLSYCKLQSADLKYADLTNAFMLFTKWDKYSRISYATFSKTVVQFSNTGGYSGDPISTAISSSGTQTHYCLSSRPISSSGNYECQVDTTCGTGTTLLGTECIIDGTPTTCGTGTKLSGTNCIVDDATHVTRAPAQLKMAYSELNCQ